MREILFRGKTKEIGRWRYGSVAKHKFEFETEEVFVIEDEEGYWAEVIPETIGQFTGLVDKNGKKIFEGDKIKLTQGIGTVEWFKTQSRFMIWLPKSNKFMRFLAGIDYEVIGNIHDNKELLQ